MKNFRKLIALILVSLMLLSAFSFAGYSKDTEIKNVIIMIGDGMGSNHLEWTKAEKDVDLFMDTLPYRGFSKTDSLSGLTDSAAGGTALSCGQKVYNSNVGTIAITAFDQGVVLADLKNVSEVAVAVGKRAGVLTSDVCSGATPASFSVHSAKRENTQIITDQELSCNLNLLWACDNGLVSKEAVTKAGKTYVSSLDDIANLKDGEKSFGVFSGNLCYDKGGENDIPLSTLTASAIENLDCQEGFFLMVEGAHIDKYSHANDMEGMMLSLIEFDKSVQTACEFAERDGHTLVIVTADHETGGITFDEQAQSWSFTKTDHSNADVPLRVYGSSDLISNGQSIENNQVGEFIADSLGYSKRFPSLSPNFRFIPDFFGQFGPWLRQSIEDLFNK